jgi:hypothetical protein
MQCVFRPVAISLLVAPALGMVLSHCLCSRLGAGISATQFSQRPCNCALWGMSEARQSQHPACLLGLDHPSLWLNVCNSLSQQLQVVVMICKLPGCSLDPAGTARAAADSSMYGSCSAVHQPFCCLCGECLHYTDRHSNRHKLHLHRTSLVFAARHQHQNQPKQAKRSHTDAHTCCC